MYDYVGDIYLKDFFIVLRYVLDWEKKKREERVFGVKGFIIKVLVDFYLRMRVVLGNVI